MYKKQKYNTKGNPRGRGIGSRNLTNKDVLQAVSLYIETGNYAEVGRQMGINRATAYNNIAKFVDEFPEQYQKMIDIFMARNKMMMTHQNACATQKALNKIDEMLDDPDACRSVKDVAMTYGILYDKGALMKGEATSNSAIVIKMAGDIEELSK